MKGQLRFEALGLTFAVSLLLLFGAPGFGQSDSHGLGTHHSSAEDLLSDLDAGPMEYSVGYTFQNHWLRKMTEQGGIKPEYDAYRMASIRHVLHGALTYRKDCALLVEAGLADLETHSREGETTQFDPANLFGFGASWTIPEVYREDVSLRLAINYRSFSVDDEKTTSEAKLTINSGGDLEINWDELEFAVSTLIKYDPYHFVLGAHYTDVTAKQDRVFPDRTVSSTFEQDGDFGLDAGVGCAFQEHFEADFKVSFVDESVFEFCLSYMF